MNARPRERPYLSGSQVITEAGTSQQGAQPESRTTSPSNDGVGVLRLRGAAPLNAPRVQWTEDVVDNEGMGKKKSKICCIYHKPRPFDESSSSESDSDSDSNSNSDSDARDAHPQGHKHAHKHKQRKQVCQPKKQTSTVNAYEIQPLPSPPRPVNP